MATAYHRDQPGAPVLTTWGYEAGVQNFTSLKLILKSCLVSGFGANPPAGWELIAEGEKHLVLRNGPHSGYVCLSFTEDYSVRVYLAETYTGVVNNVMTGDGLKSGAASGNTVPQRVSLSLLVSGDTTSSWYVVADATAFVFMSGGGYTALEASNAGDGKTWKALYVGEDTSGNFIAVGGTNAASDSPYGANGFSPSGFTTLKDPDTGFLIGSDSFSCLMPALAVHASASVTTFLKPEKVHLSPICWGRSGSLEAGRLKGVATCPTFSRTTPSQSAQSLGLSGALTTRTLNTPLDLGDAFTYFMGPGGYGWVTFMVTTNPSFW